MCALVFGVATDIVQTTEISINRFFFFATGGIELGAKKLHPGFTVLADTSAYAPPERDVTKPDLAAFQSLKPPQGEREQTR